MKYALLFLLLVGCSPAPYKFRLFDKVEYWTEFYGRMECKITDGFQSVVHNYYTILCVVPANGEYLTKSFNVEESEITRLK